MTHLESDTVRLRAYYGDKCARNIGADDEWLFALVFMLAFECIFHKNCKDISSAYKVMQFLLVDSALNCTQSLQACFSEEIKMYKQKQEARKRKRIENNEIMSSLSKQKTKQKDIETKAQSYIVHIDQKTTPELDQLMDSFDDSALTESSDDRDILCVEPEKPKSSKRSLNVENVKKNEQSNETLKPHLPIHIVENAKSLNTEFLNLSTKITMASVESLASRFASLLKDSADENGIDGIQSSTALVLSSQSLAESGGSYEAVLIHALSLVIFQTTSSARTSVLFQSCLCPLVQNLKTSSSRQLVNTIIKYAKERPMELIDSVMIPSLMNNGKSKSMCEIFARTLKVFPKDRCAQFLAAASRRPELWTDVSFPLMGACMNKRTELSVDVVKSCAFSIQTFFSGSPENLKKNIKFSNLVLSFVKCYGEQLKTSSAIAVLSNVAGELNTFVSKNIIVALKKLQEVKIDG
mmetsp:Transcript_20419/g.26399  ORF Transcript_20419/g.26399 Transcript_20419/m.26399 type:complete len:466 (+) Transcript_20419:313-1710(+)